MKLVLTQPVEIALRTLGEEDRRKVSAWLDRLKNWGNDAFVREHSHELPSTEGVYVLQTTTQFRIFFTFEQDSVVVLDIATKATIMRSGHLSEPGRK
jgi:mRNA-degrading endonuclease RelE of RelBE toxin-antitoxin system